MAKKIPQNPVIYRNVNPKTIATLSAKELRTLYSGMRSILRKRNERFISKGITPVYSTPKPVKGLSEKKIKALVPEIARQLRDPLTSLPKYEARAKKISETLKSHKYDIDPDKLGDFGRFMEATRKRQGETYKGKSGVAVQAYTELVKTGVSGKTIDRSFKKWTESQERLNTLVTVAQNLHDINGGKRVTSRQLMSALEYMD